jgi:hypothetical protein
MCFSNTISNDETKKIEDRADAICVRYIMGDGATISNVPKYCGGRAEGYQFCYSSVDPNDKSSTAECVFNPPTKESTSTATIKKIQGDDSYVCHHSFEDDPNIAIPPFLYPAEAEEFCKTIPKDASRLTCVNNVVYRCSKGQNDDDYSIYEVDVWNNFGYSSCPAGTICTIINDGQDYMCADQNSCTDTDEIDDPAGDKRFINYFVPGTASGYYYSDYAPYQSLERNVIEDKCGHGESDAPPGVDGTALAEAYCNGKITTVDIKECDCCNSDEGGYCLKRDINLDYSRQLFTDCKAKETQAPYETEEIREYACKTRGAHEWEDKLTGISCCNGYSLIVKSENCMKSSQNMRCYFSAECKKISEDI